MMNEPLSTIMTTKLITLNVSDNLDIALDILLKHKVHHLLVVDGPKLVGIITTNDLFKLNLPFDQYATQTVRSVMTTKMATLYPDDKVGAAAELFLENLFHAVPIVDGHNNVLGIVTTFDLVRYEFKKEYPNER